MLRWIIASRALRGKALRFLLKNCARWPMRRTLNFDRLQPVLRTSGPPRRNRMLSSIRPFPHGRLGLWLAALVVVVSSGCAFGEFRPSDPFDRKWTLEQAQHRYTVLVRFSEYEKARSFVIEEDRDAFMRRMEALEDAHFTDYESESVELDDEKQSAVVKVTYTVYTAHRPYEIEVEEIQEWSRDGLTNNWRVRSTFRDLAKLAAH